MKSSFILFIFIVTFAGIAPSHGQGKIKLANMEADAKHYFQADQYPTALEIYKKLDSLDPHNPRYLYPLGICYLNAFYQEEKALKCFLECFRHPERYPQSLYYYTAKSYHLSHQMDSAIKYFEIYKGFFDPKEKGYREVITRTDREIAMCENGKKMMAHPLKLEIMNMGSVINSPYPDYGPIISADEKELIFTSCRPNTTGGGKDAIDGRYYEDLYSSRYSEESGWSAPQNMGDSINTGGHDASIHLSVDGQFMLLYRYDLNPVSFSSGDIYYSELQGNAWQKAIPLPSVVNSGYYEPSASLSPDGQELYFSSNRPGGYGGTDIYVTKRLRNGEWTTPVNLGPKVNTSYDEDSPYIHSDNKTLYFSSSGHNTMGGFDIFYAEYNPETSEWSEPVNVGYPISTAYDDTHFSWSPDGKKMYFSSIRSDSYGDLDIYCALIHKEESTEVLVMKGFVLDSLDKNPLQAKIIVKQQNSEDTFGIFNSNASSGQYLIVLPEGNYKITIEAQDHIVCEQDLNISNLKGFEEVEKNIFLCHSESLR